MAYTLSTTGNSAVVNFPSLGQTITHPYSAALSSILDSVNPESLLIYPDVQNAINAGDIIIEDAPNGHIITHLSQVNRVLHHNEVLVYDRFVMTYGAIGLLSDNSYPLSFGGVSGIASLGAVFGRDWQIDRLSIGLGTAPSGNLVLRGVIDGVPQASLTFSVSNGLNFAQVNPPGLIINSGQTFNIQVVTASSAEDMVINIESRFFI